MNRIRAGGKRVWAAASIWRDAAGAIYAKASKPVPRCSKNETDGNFGIGGAKRDRTADLLHAMQALSQLSYGPIPSKAETSLHSGGFGR
jgi:hypothetical protein